MKKSRGFSVLELFIAITLFIVIMGALFLVISPSIDSFQLSSAQLDLESEVRRAIDTMTSELMQTRIAKITEGPVNADNINYNAIRFAVPYDIDTDGDIINDNQVMEWSDASPANWTVRYSLVGSQIIRSAGDGLNPVLANNISSLTFRRPSYNPNTIEINISAQKSTSKNRSVQVSLSSLIKMRN